MNRDGRTLMAALLVATGWGTLWGGEAFPKPYSGPCTQREERFEFTEAPAVKALGNDRYQITFAVQGSCDVTAAVVDRSGAVVRHLGAGVLGSNAPAPFQKNSLRQVIFWNGKDDLGEYVKDPEQLSVGVWLGLKPEFSRLLGDGGPKNLPGYVFGLAVGPEGAYVFCQGEGSKGHLSIRRFDLNGRYLGSLTPPPANLALEKLSGMGYVEYEAGARALHGVDCYQTVADRGNFLPGGQATMAGCQPGLFGNRLWWCNWSFDPQAQKPSRLFSLFTDGSSEVRGLTGIPFSWTTQRHPHFAVSPDGKWLYASNLTTGAKDSYTVLRRATDGDEVAVPFLGRFTPGKRPGQFSAAPGSDEGAFGSALGIDCDAQGRIYVADQVNNRIQVFSPEGKPVHSVGVDRPKLVRVHQTSGALYVQHQGRHQGKSVDRITKFSALPQARELFHADGLPASALALDSWSPNPRLWTAGNTVWVHGAGAGGAGPSVRIWEENGQGLKLLEDFEQEARAAGGPGYLGRWGGAAAGPDGKLVCDGVREKAYFDNRHIFDLKSGAYEGEFRVNGRGLDDIAFDRKGYLHIHWNPGFEFPGVGRVDPSRGRPEASGKPGVPQVFYPEVPYDYGEEESAKRGWRGILPVKDQPGAKFFQDGMGVNMRGEVAIESNIYYVPKFEDVGRDLAFMGVEKRSSETGFTDMGEGHFDFMKQIQEAQKRGEDIYAIRREPGIPLCGATLWTYQQTGELAEECAVIAGGLINGVQIDEDGRLYFVNNRPRILAGRPFLEGQGGILGAAASLDAARRNQAPGFNSGPHTGTLLKSAGGKVRLVAVKAPVPLDQPPARPAELRGNYGDDGEWWAEGAEWLYAGASPIVYGGCSCPVQRLHLDWFKRTYVPEAYRHSIAILDTNGNLIMHLGRYGNYDSGQGAASRVPIGGDQIAMFLPRFIGGTDERLCFSDWGERLAVLRLDYHARASAPITRSAP